MAIDEFDDGSDGDGAGDCLKLIILQKIAEQLFLYWLF